jgi:asparagine synthase (glutamine-hydrolysing)
LGAVAASVDAREGRRADVVERMVAAAPHRGSTTQGLQHGRCALACVHDDAFEDAQIAVAGRVAAVFAGTLDNLDEVLRELKHAGAAPPERTPAAVVAAGYGHWHERLPERLRGVFAAVVSDGHELVCFRDALGLAPLFYRADRNGLCIASEPKQVVAGAEIRREPDLDVLEQTLFETYDSETPSALRGVRRVPKGMVLRSDGTNARLMRFWEPRALLESASYSDADLLERFDALMEQAVARCLAGDDAILLSGGIDSPAIAAYAAPRHRERFQRPLVAITAVYPRFAAVDERSYTQFVADRLEIPLHTWEPETRPLDDLETWVRLVDGPVVAGSLALYADAYRVTREHGHRSVLTGEFAEFVCTLDGFVMDHLLAHGRFTAALRRLSQERRRGSSPADLIRLVAAAVAPGRLLAARLARTSQGVPHWVDRSRANEAAAQSLVGPGGRWSKLQVSAFTGAGSSVEAEEICQAVSGVRMRRPFADLDLWSFFLSLRAEAKFPDLQMKSLLRRLLRGRVPDKILDRRDKTFFDDAALASVSYPTLRRLLENPEHRFAGVDYHSLAELLRREQMGIVDYVWVMKLASVHAFLAREWTPTAPLAHA